jgi:hypothetical protein
MMNNIFPRKVSNDYQGNPIAKWVFFVITLVTIMRSLVHILAPDGGAQSIATIPLDNYSEAAAATVILMFSLWGLSQLLMGFVYAIVLWRYQALIPFMYVLLIIEYGMRIILGMLKPIETAGTAPGGIGNFIFLPIAILMLILSFLKSKKAGEKV